MKKMFGSAWFALVFVIICGAAVAYKRISRNQRATEAATQARIKAEVESSLSGLKIEMKPLSEAGSGN